MTFLLIYYDFKCYSNSNSIEFYPLATLNDILDIDEWLCVHKKCLLDGNSRKVVKIIDIKIIISFGLTTLVENVHHQEIYFGIAAGNQTRVSEMQFLHKAKKQQTEF